MTLLGSRPADKGNTEETGGIQVRIMQQNCWMNETDRGRRTDDLVRGILLMDPDIVCLQEVITRDVKAALQSKLKERYHILETNHTFPSFPALAYVPCGVVTGIAFIAALLGWKLSILGFILLAAGMLVLSPQGLFSCANYMITNDTTPSLDMMGQSVLVRRRDDTDTSHGRGWESASVVGVYPFPHKMRGYPSPTSFIKAIFYWVQHCFIRPGFIVVRAKGGLGGCQDAWILSTHLVVSKPSTDHNSKRLAQVQYMNTILDQHMIYEASTSCKESNTSAEPFIMIAGDFNAPPESPEVRFMRSSGFTDTCEPSEKTRSRLVEPQISFRTWDRELNPYTESDMDEPDNRLDYVFVAGKRISCVKTERVFDGIKMPIVSDHFGVLATLELGLD